jgi:D-xylulose reductase
MRALVLEKANELRIRDYPVRQEMGPRDVRIRVASVGVCGSDVHYYKHGRIGDFVVRAPMVLGHEASGRVLEVGREVKHLAAGDRVCMEPGVFDPMSRESMRGMYNLDPSVSFWATPPIDGVLCDAVVHPANLTFKLPDHVSFEEGALVEPLAIGVHAMKKVGVSPGDRAVVLGAGTIGIVSALAAVASGCSHVIVADVKQEKLDFVARHYGARITAVNVAKEPLLPVVERLFPFGADLLVEASGNAKAAARFAEYLAPGGKAVFVGMPQEPIAMDIVAAQVKEITMYTIFRYANVYERAIHFIASGQIDVKPLVSRRFAFDESLKAFELASSGAPDVIKVMINLQ